MAPNHPKRPRDLNQWAKRMVDMATMDEEELAKLRADLAKQKPDNKGEKPQMPGKRAVSSSD